MDIIDILLEEYNGKANLYYENGIKIGFASALISENQCMFSLYTYNHLPKKFLIKNTPFEINKKNNMSLYNKNIYSLRNVSGNKLIKIFLHNCVLDNTENSVGFNIHLKDGTIKKF